MASKLILKGSCYCTAVSYTISDAPLVKAYCHCTICQRLTACPFVHTLHFDASAFSWTYHAPYEGQLDSFVAPDKSWKTRWRCKTCGAAVASFNSRSNRWAVWAAQLERDAEGKIKEWDVIKPTTHIFYGTRMLDVDDGLSKWEGYENASKRLD